MTGKSGSPISAHQAGCCNNPPASLPLSTTLNVWAVGPNVSWELDFWGRLRRSVESSDASLYSSVDAYRDALVTQAQVQDKAKRFDDERKSLDSAEAASKSPDNW